MDRSSKETRGNVKKVLQGLLERIDEVDIISIDIVTPVADAVDINTGWMKHAHTGETDYTIRTYDRKLDGRKELYSNCGSRP